MGYVLRNADLILVDAEDMIGKCRQLAGTQVNVKLFPVGIETRKYKPAYENEVVIWREKLKIPLMQLFYCR